MNPAHIECPPGHQITLAEKKRRVANLATQIMRGEESHATGYVTLTDLYRRESGGFIRKRRFLGYRCHLRVLAKYGELGSFDAEGNGQTPLEALCDALSQPVPIYLTPPC